MRLPSLALSCVYAKKYPSSYLYVRLGIFFMLGVFLNEKQHRDKMTRYWPESKRLNRVGYASRYLARYRGADE